MELKRKPVEEHSARGTDYGVIIAEMIKALKTKINNGEPAHLPRDHPEVREMFKGKNKNVSEDDFIQRLRQTESGVIRATDHSYTFSEFYPVRNKQQLLKFMIEKGDIGIKDNYKLWVCYDGVKQDVEDLIQEGWIRVVEYSDAKKKAKAEQDKKQKKVVEAPKRMFFPKDLSDPDVEYTKEQLPLNCHKFLADLWDKKVGDIKWEQILQEEQGLLSEQEKEILVTRKVKSQAHKQASDQNRGMVQNIFGTIGKKRMRTAKLQNDHLDFDFDFSQVY